MAKRKSVAASGGSEGTAVADNCQKAGREMLDLNPALACVFVTGDGYCFGSECDARNHAAAIKQELVVKVERESAELNDSEGEGGSGDE